jgi:hypothetical protein
VTFKPFWLIPQALVQALLHQSCSNIVDNVKGILFFGTPHRGAGHAKRLNKMLKVLGCKKLFVKQLRKNEPTLSEINEDFLNCTPSIKLYSFYESRGVPGAGVSRYKSLQGLIVGHCG